jgi:hypothetical protein
MPQVMETIAGKPVLIIALLKIRHNQRAPRDRNDTLLALGALGPSSRKLAVSS